MSKVIALVLIIGMNLGAGYLLGSNNGRNLKDQYLDIELVCLKDMVKISKDHAKSARAIVGKSNLTSEQAHMYTYARLFECIRDKVIYE